MENKYLKDPYILTAIGLILISSLSALAVLMLNKSSSQESAQNKSNQEITIINNPGTAESLQAEPMQLQSGDNSVGQSSNDTTLQLQSQSSIAPEQLQNLQ